MLAGGQRLDCPGDELRRLASQKLLLGQLGEPARTHGRIAIERAAGRLESAWLDGPAVIVVGVGERENGVMRRSARAARLGTVDEDPEIQVFSEQRPSNLASPRITANHVSWTTSSATD